MKRISFSFLLVFFFSISYGQLSNTQATIITKVSADWCPTCGSWAWTAFEQMRADFAEKDAIHVLAHRDGNLMSDVSLGWCTNLEFQYQPEFYLNNDHQNILANNATDKIFSMGEQIDAWSGFGAFVGLESQGFLTDIEDQLFAETKIEFFSEIQGEFYLGVYVLQNNIMAFQQSQGVVLQPHLLTGAFHDDWFGIPVDGTAGLQTFDLMMDKPDDFSDIDGDTEILTVIWNKLADGTYIMFNASVNSTIITESSSNELDENINSFKTRLLQNELVINFESTIASKNAIVTLTNSAGQKVFSTNAVTIQEGSNGLNFNLPSLASGMYIATMKIGNKQISNKNIKL